MQFIRRSITGIAQKSLIGQKWSQNVHAYQAKLRYSISTDRITVTTNSDTRISELKMHNPSVNCMSYQFFEESIEAIKNLEKDNCKALIISSAIPKIFSAGLDLKELVKPTPERFVKYMKMFEKYLLAVYTAKFATISAINGVAPGGGCILALVSDYRIILPTGSIGLNEVTIGLPLSLWIIQLCANVTGKRNAEVVGLTGEIFKAERALKLGLVDEIATNTNDLMQKALAQAKIYANLPDIESWHITKMEGRKQTVELIKKRPISSPKNDNSISQSILAAHAEKLKNKK